MPFHGANERPSKKADLTQMICTNSGIDGDTVVTIPSSGHAVEITSVVDIESPKFTCLVPTSVGGVGSENEEKSQRWGKQGEGSKRESQLREGCDDSFMLHPAEVGIPSSQCIPKDDERSDGGGREDFPPK